MLGGSEKPFHDAVRVYEVQHGRLDEAHLDRWAAALDVGAALARLRAAARPSSDGSSPGPTGWSGGRG